jgi:hypothetical protein
VIRCDSDVPRWIDDFIPVAAAEIQYIIVKERIEDLDRLADAVAPFLRTLAPQGLAPDIIVIGLVVVDRMLRQFEMRHQHAIAEYRSASAGAERQHDLQSSPLDDSEALDLGVVVQTNRLAETLGQGGGQWEIAPWAVTEMRRREGSPIADHARKSHGNSIESGQRCYQSRKRSQKNSRRAGVRRRDTNSVDQHFAGAIENRCLKSGAADDRREPGFQRRWIGHLGDGAVGDVIAAIRRERLAPGEAQPIVASRSRTVCRSNGTISTGSGVSLTMR